MNPFVLTLELLLEVAGQTPFRPRQANYESETLGQSEFAQLAEARAENSLGT